MGVKQWLVSLAVVALSATVIQAKVDDPAGKAAQYHKEYALFKSENMPSPDKLSSGVGFHSFRIPAVIRTNTGRILAFAEGRRHNNRDYGDINLVYKRTKTPTNNGENPSDWESLREVVGTGPHTWGNPTPVVDSNTIYLFLSMNDGAYSQNGNNVLPNGEKTKKIDSTWVGRRHLYLTESIDDGNSWSKPVDMTKTLTPDGQAWDAVGPGNGIKLTSGELVIPAQGRNIIGTGPAGNRTWSMQILKGAGSEGTICQTPDGKLLRNDRPGPKGHRSVARGTLSGFGPFATDNGLPDPACQGSILSYNRDEPARTIFMNSASVDRRTAMRVRISYDKDAAKFNYGRDLQDAPLKNVGNEGGYSSMTKTSDYKIGALVESDWYEDKGGEKSHRAIIWRRFNLSWIINGPHN
ncbi:putative exo-alpha-sialidase [Microsporum ferrugineum]